MITGDQMGFQPIELVEDLCIALQQGQLVIDELLTSLLLCQN